MGGAKHPDPSTSLVLRLPYERRAFARLSLMRSTGPRSASFARFAVVAVPSYGRVQESAGRCARLSRRLCHRQRVCLLSVVPARLDGPEQRPEHLQIGRDADLPTDLLRRRRVSSESSIRWVRFQEEIRLKRAEN
jgi:hypothetical protein